MPEKGGKGLVPDPDYMVDALKLPNQAPRVSGESLQTFVAWRFPDGSQHLFCWPFWSFLSHQIHSGTFLALVLVWPPFGLLHRALTTIVSTQYYRMGPISHPQSPSIKEMGRFHSV
ncbi:hypothetical protein TNCV_2299551 [Trichonephila clavipes]|nr:hypothetical protein TNCV_2299551 [Trichonephila clavipes]